METPTTTMILEINLISAQNLKNTPSSSIIRRRDMRTYALAWVNPKTKLRSHLDLIGGENPTWNDKFIFRVSHAFINSDTSGVQFQIYAVGFIRDYFIGTVRYILSTTPTSVTGVPHFSALHIRRPSGRVHGVLNIAATVYRSSDFPSLNAGISAICVSDLIGGKNKKNVNHDQCVKDESESPSSSSSDECEESSVYFSDGKDRRSTQESSSFATVRRFREGDIVVAGDNNINKEWKKGGCSCLCGL